MAPRQNNDGSDSVKGVNVSLAPRVHTAGPQNNEYSTSPDTSTEFASSGSMNTSFKHVRSDGSSSFVTVLVDLTPVVDGTGPARLLDMISGRSAKVLTDWLDARDQAFRDRIKVVTMDGFAGYHTASAKAVPEARTVTDPFQVVHLAAEKLTLCRQRIQQDTTGHRGPLYLISRYHHDLIRLNDASLLHLSIVISSLDILKP